MLPTFADPKTDVVFKRIFGSEARRALLIALLNDLLELEGTHRISGVQQRSRRSQSAVIDVTCTTASGRRFIVVMQVLHEGAEKRVAHDAASAYATQIREAGDHHKLCDVVGVTICGFKLWRKKVEGGGFKVPMLSHWRMYERKSGNRGLRQIQYAFLELPKYSAGPNPQTAVDKWAYFFRQSWKLRVIPKALSEGPFREALEIARRTTFTDAEWAEYERSRMAEAERGKTSSEHREGEIKAAARAVLTVLQARGIPVPESARAQFLAEKDRVKLSGWLERAAIASSIDDVLDEERVYRLPMRTYIRPVRVVTLLQTDTMLSSSKSPPPGAHVHLDKPPKPSPEPQPEPPPEPFETAREPAGDTAGGGLTSPEDHVVAFDDKSIRPGE